MENVLESQVSFERTLANETGRASADNVRHNDLLGSGIETMNDVSVGASASVDDVHRHDPQERGIGGGGVGYVRCVGVTEAKVGGTCTV
jgi:hypothetical protein